MFQLDDVSVHSRSRALLSHVSLHIHEQEKVVIWGPSGSGKTTLLKTLLGVYQPSSGAVYFQGEPLNPKSIQRLRQLVAYIPQSPVLGAQTVGEAFMLPFTYRANKDAPSRQVLVEQLEAFNLSPSVLDQPTRVLSGGECQRIVIARALLLSKQIFIVDEITSALDQISKEIVINRLMVPAFTVISVSHDADWIRSCARHVRIAHGQLTGVPA